jgi:hypothetical protein
MDGNLENTAINSAKRKASPLTSEDGARIYVRVDGYLPLDYGVVTEDEETFNRMKGCNSPYDFFTKLDVDVKEIELEGNEKDRAFAKLLLNLDRKMNLIISSLIEGKGSLDLPKVRRVNISASGARFSTDDRVEIGTKLWIKIFLSIYPFSPLYLIGEVQRSVKEPVKGDESAYMTAIKYVNLNEDERDRIIRYVLSNQREVLKAQRK